MPFAPGTPKPPNSGRKKGSFAKAGSSPPIIRGTVDQILSDVGCNPIRGLALIAMDEKVEAATRTRAYAELAQYQHPKRRAIELSGPDGGPVETLDVSPTELLERRLDDLAGGTDTSEPVDSPVAGETAEADTNGYHP